MNYIDATVGKLAETMPCDEDLLRLYALLALTVGTSCTNTHVHDAWAVWRTTTNPKHPSLVPYDQLTPADQEVDGSYAAVIRAVAKAEIRAAGLPQGTVVATADDVWIQRTDMHLVRPIDGDPYIAESRRWEGTDESRDGLAFDRDIDGWIASGHAQVLRIGGSGRRS
jgi:hypothetical protein